MSSMAIFSLASQQSDWLTVRQSTIAANVANANTPGYRAVDVQPFSAVMAHTQLSMAATNPGHIDFEPTSANSAPVRPKDSWQVTYSGNSVSLEQEMMKAGEVNRAYAMNVNIVRSFHQMLMSTVKS